MLAAPLHADWAAHSLAETRRILAGEPKKPPPWGTGTTWHFDYDNPPHPAVMNLCWRENQADAC